MRLYTLHDIVRGYLLKKGKSMHYYIEYLAHAVDALRELSFDSLKTVKRVKLPVNSYQAVVLPCDYVDFIKIGFPRGQYVVEMSSRTSLNRLNNIDDTGAKVPYEIINGDDDSDVGAWTGEDYFWETNANGELLGKQFNNNGGYSNNSYKVLRERGEIQLDNRFAGEYVVLEYIGDGLDTNAESEVHPYAQATIEAYIAWKSSKNADNITSPEGFNFYNNHRILRSRLNDITLLDIVRMKQRGNKAVIKN
jgi:hypothetical protein